VNTEGRKGAPFGQFNGQVTWHSNIAKEMGRHSHLLGSQHVVCIQAVKEHQQKLQNVLIRALFIVRFEVLMAKDGGNMFLCNAGMNIYAHVALQRTKTILTVLFIVSSAKQKGLTLCHRTQ
jgi:hypothetical protein